MQIAEAAIDLFRIGQLAVSDLFVSFYHFSFHTCPVWYELAISITISLPTCNVEFSFSTKLHLIMSNKSLKKRECTEYR